MRRAVIVSALLVGASAGCGDGDDAPTGSADAGLASIGDAPGPVTDRTSPSVPDVDEIPATPTSTSPDVEPRPVEPPIGAAVERTGLLLIGDDVLATTTDRNDGIGCDVLTEFGWDVEIAAEPGRFVDFAETVLDARLGSDPAVVGIMLGHRYDGALEEYRATLRSAVDAVGDRPVILYTLGGVYVDDDAAGIDSGVVRSLNGVIEAIGRDHPNVVIVDWSAAAETDPDVLLVDGGPTPTTDGSGRIVVLTAGVLDDAPGDGEPGECVDSEFDSDEAIII